MGRQLVFFSSEVLIDRHLSFRPRLFALIPRMVMYRVEA
jgi:hypothetical protein